MEILNSITIRHVKKYYGSGNSQVKALDGVDLSVAQGEFVAIVGASGSGKTTLLNMMGALDVPTEGEVIVDGVNLGGLREEQRSFAGRRLALSSRIIIWSPRSPWRRISCFRWTWTALHLILSFWRR